jgi:leucyl/phenylalanyl-tRNA--protein transferase
VSDLPNAPWFPDLRGYDGPGEYVTGGAFTAPWFLAAYRAGFFPWPEAGAPLSWWNVGERMVFEPERFRASRSLRRTIRRGRFDVTLDRDFPEVLRHCAQKRGPGREGTWIVPNYQTVFRELFELGLAHSVEVWSSGALAGGLYGLSLGRLFVGESMFSDDRDASKVAMAALCAHLAAWEFELFDAQVPTPHLESLGGIRIPRDEYLTRLRRALAHPTREGRWELERGAFAERYGGAA